METSALVLAPEPATDWFTAGLRLSERARRVAVKAGVSPERVAIVRTAAELAEVADRCAAGPLLVIRTTGQIVANELVTPLDTDAPGSRAAFDRSGAYAGAIRVDTEAAARVVNALRADFARGDETIAATLDRVEVGDRARHPAATRDALPAAVAWQWQAVRKPMDVPLVRWFYRPAAAPFTRLFLHTPLSANAISVLSSVISLAGCAIAAAPSYGMHILGLAILVFGGILDHCDGAVARLRVEESNMGARLDALGDDLARLALVIAVGVHVGAAHPDWPIGWITAGALALTLTGMGLIYWYCIVVVGSVSNQDYEAVLGVGNKVPVAGKKSLGRILGDLGTTAARRVFIDLAILAFAIAGVPWVSLIGLTGGAAMSLVIILPAHLGIVRGIREGRIIKRGRGTSPAPQAPRSAP